MEVYMERITILIDRLKQVYTKTDHNVHVQGVNVQYVIIGSNFVPLEGKFLLMITLKVIMSASNAPKCPLNNGVPIVQTLKHFDNVISTSAKTLSKCLRVWPQVFERWTHRCLANI